MKITSSFQKPTCICSHLEFLDQQTTTSPPHNDNFRSVQLLTSTEIFLFFLIIRLEIGKEIIEIEFLRNVWPRGTRHYEWRWKSININIISMSDINRCLSNHQSYLFLKVIFSSSWKMSSANKSFFDGYLMCRKRRKTAVHNHHHFLNRFIASAVKFMREPTKR